MRSYNKALNLPEIEFADINQILEPVRLEAVRVDPDLSPFDNSSVNEIASYNNSKICRLKTACDIFTENYKCFMIDNQSSSNLIEFSKSKCMMENDKNRINPFKGETVKCILM